MNCSIPLHIILSLLLAFPPRILAQLAPLDDSALEAERQLQTIDTFITLASDFREHLTREAFELLPLLDSLDYEPQSIISFVKNSVEFEQYAGTMRGAVGTLQGLAGNTLDQSILLATLLKRAGNDVRIARTILNEDQARTVLTQLGKPSSQQFPLGNAGALMKAVETSGLFEPLNEERRTNFEKLVEAAPPPQSSRDFEELLPVQEMVLASLENAGLKLANPNAMHQILEEAQEYFWVQTRLDSSQPWEDIHPVFRLTEDPGFPDAIEVFKDKVPDQFQHKLRVQVFLEKSVQDQLELTPLTSPWERPVANLVNEPLIFVNIPNSLLKPDADRFGLEEALEEATLFVPTLGGDIAPGASFFDLNGNLIDPTVAGSAAAGVFQEVGGRFDAGVRALAGEKAAPSVTAQILRFTLISPLGEETTFSRTIFDRIGPAARESGHAGDVGSTSPSDIRTIMQAYTIMIATGRTHRAFALDSGLEQLILSKPHIKSVLRAINDLPPQNDAGADSSSKSTSKGWIGMPTLLSELDRAEQLSSRSRIYRSGPGIIAFREGLAKKAGMMAAVDIITSPRRAIRKVRQELRFDPQAVMLAGLWETLSEGLMLPDGPKTKNTSTAFEWAKLNGSNIVVLEPTGQQPELSDISPDTLAAIQSDLTLGYTVIVPDRESAPGENGWWRVDVSTGETLGQYGDGRGSESTEFGITEMASSALSIIFFLVGVRGCVTSGESGLKGYCCIGVNFAFLFAGVFLGAALTFKSSGEAAFFAFGFDAASAVVWGNLVTAACQALVD